MINLNLMKFKRQYKRVWLQKLKELNQRQSIRDQVIKHNHRLRILSLQLRIEYPILLNKIEQF